ncbi:unnamed protein product [Microthlaspi erraticum]|uniref:Uncharacterized protein n=1 Tax=Microthlaspi erraticum TaxID=1685480 RepID=A0A6D2KZV6_9BRAS|nr:unnamed protein product [Microthlaspi erraticum]
MEELVENDGNIEDHMQVENAVFAETGKEVMIQGETLEAPVAAMDAAAMPEKRLERKQGAQKKVFRATVGIGSGAIRRLTQAAKTPKKKVISKAATKGVGKAGMGDDPSGEDQPEDKVT